MAHKSRARGQHASPDPLPQRITRARRESRFQQALELARQVYKHEPNEANLDVLRQVSFERGQQLENQKHLKEAAALYANASDMGGNDDFRRQLIERLAFCGAGQQALNLAQRLGDSQLVGRAQSLLVDAAMRLGPAGKATLAADLQLQFDAVWQAFAHAEAGRDDDARSALQTLGLQSSFLEWRVLLRGLLAYYAGDDQRALENWQRLDPKRLPARLAAPLRFGIDAAYRAAQAPATQNQLRQQLDRLQGSPLVPGLRLLQPLLAHENKLGQAFRQADNLLPALRQQAPDLVPRLAACFRWSIIEDGQPEDRDRYLRVFGPAPEDPNLNRLSALAMEKRGDWVEAHLFWRAFEQDVAEKVAAWPEDQVRHVRALILTHMGELAAEHELGDVDDEDDGFPFEPPLGRARKKSKLPFQPAAEECFRRSLQVAPEVLATHEALFEYLQESGNHKKALEAGTNLLERFPEHVRTLEALATLCMGEGRFDDAQDYLKRALQVNPLDRGLRVMLEKVHEFKARNCSADKHFDEARAECQAALALHDMPARYPLLCLAAGIELKAKNQARYEELVAQAQANVPQRLAVSYCLMCESIRQKMSPAHKKAFLGEFQAGLAQPLDASEVGRLVALASLQRSAGPPYVGQKTHEKKILALVTKNSLQDFPEDKLEGLCSSLATLEAVKLRKLCCDLGRKRFPRNPVFLLEETKLMLKGRARYPWKVARNLDQARKLIEALPGGNARERLRGELQDLERKQREVSGAPAFLGELMDRFFQFSSYGEDDEDDEDIDEDDDF